MIESTTTAIGSVIETGSSPLLNVHEVHVEVGIKSEQDNDLFIMFETSVY
jgi:hypothetical protein